MYDLKKYTCLCKRGVNMGSRQNILLVYMDFLGSSYPSGYYL